MFRESDSLCTGEDSAPLDEKVIPFRRNIDCLSEESTKMLLSRTQPRPIISGHTHHYCLRFNSEGPTTIYIPEYSVPSFSWRNRDDPSFFLVSFPNTQCTTTTLNNFSIHILLLRDYLRKMNIDYPNAIYLKKAR
jgi:hypothetical protein